MNPQPAPMSQHENQDQSFTFLYRKYKEKIYNHAASLTSSAAHAEDITQDVFLNLWRYRDRWAEIENMQAYLFFCTRNKTMDYFQRAKLEKENLQQVRELPVLYDSPEIKMEIKEAERMYEEAVRRLPGQQQKVYTLRRLHGWKRKEIARELNLSDNTVKQHMQSAIRSVREFMVKEMSL